MYNKGANIENAIKELKEDYQIGKIVTDSFYAKDVSYAANRVHTKTTIKVEFLDINSSGFFIDLKKSVLKKMSFGKTKFKGRAFPKSKALPLNLGSASTRIFY